MNEIPNDAAICSIYLNQFNSICRTQCRQVVLDKRVSELVSTKPIQVLVPELVVLLEIQVLNSNLTNMPIFA